MGEFEHTAAESPTEPSIAFEAGRKAAEQKIPLTKSALRKLRPGSRQYEDFICGYDSVSMKRVAKKKHQLHVEGLERYSRKTTCC